MSTELSLDTIDSRLVQILNMHNYERKLNIINISLDEGEVAPGFSLKWEHFPKPVAYAIFRRRYEIKA